MSEQEPRTREGEIIPFFEIEARERHVNTEEWPVISTEELPVEKAEEKEEWPLIELDELPVEKAEENEEKERKEPFSAMDIFF